MKYIVIILFSVFSFSQVEEPVSWSFEVNCNQKDEYTLEAVATIAPGWHIYSQYKDPASFIRETSFYFDNNNDINFFEANIEKKDNGFVKFFF